MQRWRVDFLRKNIDDVKYIGEQNEIVLFKSNVLFADDFSNRTDDDKTPAPNDDSSSSQTDLPEDQPIKIYKSIKEFDKNLPHTVTKLTTPHGSMVYLVGTAHFSKESQDDVSLVS